MVDANGQAVAYVYFRRDENEARQARVLTSDDARRRKRRASTNQCRQSVSEELSTVNNRTGKPHGPSTQKPAEPPRRKPAWLREPGH